AGSVTVDARQEDFPGAEVGAFARPRGRVNIVRNRARTRGDPPAAGFAGAARVAGGVDGDDHTLRTVAVRQLAGDGGAGDGGAVDADTVGAGVEEAARVISCLQASANGQRDLQAAADTPEALDAGESLFEGGRYVEDHDLVGALVLVACSELSGIA